MFLKTQHTFSEGITNIQIWIKKSINNNNKHENIWDHKFMSVQAGSSLHYTGKIVQIVQLLRPGGTIRLSILLPRFYFFFFFSKKLYFSSKCQRTLKIITDLYAQVIRNKVNFWIFIRAHVCIFCMHRRQQLATIWH